MAGLRGKPASEYLRVNVLIKCYCFMFVVLNNSSMPTCPKILQYIMKEDWKYNSLYNEFCTIDLNYM
jgi:hypothetical protein